MGEKRKALGKGLAALLKDPNEDVQTVEEKGADEVIRSISELPIERIQANPYQPRTFFDEESLNELAVSIRELGVIQPITVRRIKKKKYELISGERRLRASKLAGLSHIPAYIRLADDQGMLEMALVENIQRKELDAVEVALSYQRLMDECGITQEEVSQRVGKKRSTVTNYLRLLKLPPIIQAGLRDQMLSMGHARALVNIVDEKDQLSIYKTLITNGLNVRQVEDEVQRLNDEKTGKKGRRSSTLRVNRSLSGELSELIGSGVKVKERQGNPGGELVISFKDDQELERILSSFRSE
ncbi:MAG: putative chromosome-partitioning protein ParB [Flavobacteriia bacterium]|nr:MAG: putative chromosome-partitioning protein ParB [Flavobacteriia bacterium]